MSSVLVDGSLSSLPVLLAVLVASALLVSLSKALVIFALVRSPGKRGAWLFLVPLAFVLAVATPITVGVLIRLFMGSLFSFGASLCLMPTNYFVRDWGPGVVALLAGIHFGRIRIQELRQSTAV